MKEYWIAKFNLENIIQRDFAIPFAWRRRK
jgi:hypothetical protein